MKIVETNSFPFIILGLQIIGWSCSVIFIVYFLYKRLKNEKKEDFEKRNN